MKHILEKLDDTIATTLDGFKMAVFELANEETNTRNAIFAHMAHLETVHETQAGVGEKLRNFAQAILPIAMDIESHAERTEYDLSVLADLSDEAYEEYLDECECDGDCDNCSECDCDDEEEEDE